jgi:hypothetical protein
LTDGSSLLLSSARAGAVRSGSAGESAAGPAAVAGLTSAAAAAPDHDPVGIAAVLVRGTGVADATDPDI